MTDSNNAPAASPSSQSTRPPLHTVLPPLILGTATFNTQYVADPHSMPYRDIVARAIAHGITAFDTSPYYGPSEELLGTALDELTTSQQQQPTALSRSDLTIITKAGRIASSEFDYSPAWIRYSVLRSLRRLRTPYLDLVYAHDVEWVSPPEVLAAVRELRRLRDEDGIIRYVGISGFPVDVLCDLAEMVRRETGEPLDAVMSFGNFTVQNRRLGAAWLGDDCNNNNREDRPDPLTRLKQAGVDVVLNASMLGMGLLTSRGIPPDPNNNENNNNNSDNSSPLAKWHPSPPGLRQACKQLAAIAARAGERLESVALRWSLAEWARVGSAAGVGVDYAPNVPGISGSSASGSSGDRRVIRIGPSVCGVSSVAELDETVAEWRGAVQSLLLSGEGEADKKDARARQDKVASLVRTELWPALGPSWLDYAWESPGPGYVNSRREADRGVVPDDGVVAAYERARQGRGEGELPSLPGQRSESPCCVATV